MPQLIDFKSRLLGKNYTNILINEIPNFMEASTGKSSGSERAELKMAKPCHARGMQIPLEKGCANADHGIHWTICAVSDKPCCTIV